MAWFTPVSSCRTHQATQHFADVDADMDDPLWANIPMAAAASKQHCHLLDEFRQHATNNASHLDGQM